VTGERPQDLSLTVAAPPEPSLLRAAIEARLRGRPWPGPEGAVGDAVAAAIERAQAEREGERWPT
jgi:hypothetical protein